jgi:asparagine synthase (glutamine-hydrolysing)
VVPAYHCARFAREHGVALMLAGDGGDELFAGNTRYVEQDKFERYFTLPRWLRGALEIGYRLLPLLAQLPVSGKGARYIRQAHMGLPDRLQSYNFLHRFDPRTVFAADWLQQVDTDAPWRLWRERYAAPGAGDALQRMLYLDWKFTLADSDLVKVNNMCDLAGIEVCYPMLDERIAELAVGLSAPTLLHGGVLRGFYKYAVRDFLPPAIIAKSKHGFGLPFGVWMREDQGLRDLAGDALAGLKHRHIFRPEFIDEATRLHREETAAGYYGELVWLMTMLELWYASHAAP